MGTPSLHSMIAICVLVSPLLVTATAAPPASQPTKAPATRPTSQPATQAAAKRVAFIVDRTGTMMAIAASADRAFSLAMESLGERDTFCVIVHAEGKVQDFTERWVRNTPKNQKTAIDLVTEERCAGPGNLSDDVTAAIKLQADTIYVITDGDDAADNEIHDVVKQPTGRRVVINPIYIQNRGDLTLLGRMQRLAARNSGTLYDKDFKPMEIPDEIKSPPKPGNGPTPRPPGKKPLFE